MCCCWTAIGNTREVIADEAGFDPVLGIIEGPQTHSELPVQPWLPDHVDTVDVGFELSSTEAIKRPVATGAPLGCLSRLAVAPALASGELRELNTGLPAAYRRLAVVVHHDPHLGRGTTDFLRLCEAAR